jgi:hypothetical protein
MNTNCSLTPSYNATPSHHNIETRFKYLQNITQCPIHFNCDIHSCNNGSSSLEKKNRARFPPLSTSFTVRWCHNTHHPFTRKLFPGNNVQLCRLLSMLSFNWSFASVSRNLISVIQTFRTKRHSSSIMLTL